MDTAQSRVGILRDCIASQYRHGAATVPEVAAKVLEIQTIHEVENTLTEADSDVEVAFRSVLAELIAKALETGQDITNEEAFGVRDLLDLALGATKDENTIGRKAPFHLLEDLFDILVIEQVEAMWPVIEEREAAIFEIMSKSAKKLKSSSNHPCRLLMLKMCNSLLRKLSKSHNTAICGRIMMFLSRNWDLSEMSAINRGGHVNTANKTTYEDEDEFDRQQAIRQTLEEKKKRDEELRMTIDGQEKALAEGKDAAPIDYSLYQTFWGLQEHLCDPKHVIDSEEVWDQFITSANTVLKAFEGFTVSEDTSSATSVTAQAAAAAASQAAAAAAESTADEGEEDASVAANGGEDEGGGGDGEAGDKDQQQQQQQDEDEATTTEEGPSKKRARSTSQTDAGGDITEGYLGCKYLTNSRLFRLQLHDPLVRVQVLTQVLTLLNLSAATPPASGSTRPGASDLTKHARRLIRSTPPHGSAYLTTLDTVLDREKTWLHWKKVARCVPPIEKPPAPPASKIRSSEIVKKALAEAEKPTVVLSQQRRAFYDRPLKLPRPVDLDAISKEVGKSIVTFDSYVVQQVEEANDPENCIEAEYHPRTNPIFCWRALRLACSTNPKAVVDLETGALDTLFNKVRWKEEDKAGDVMKKEEGEPQENGGVAAMEVEPQTNGHS